MSDYEAFFMNAVNPKVVERIELPMRQANYAPPPPRYATGRLHKLLNAMTGRDEIWTHQAKALEYLENGANVVMATSTASGKSLPFQAYAVRKLLEDRAKTIVFYPLKALAADQFKRWQKAFATTGLDPAQVAEITGETPMAEREAALRDKSVILATHDVFHCWFMPQASTPLGQRFLADLGFVILDEAHVLEAVFGSHAAFLFRRLRLAAYVASMGVGGRSHNLQFFASTATIADPADHLEALTGVPFETINDDDNGAPFPGATLLHIEGPSHGQIAERMLADIIGTIASQIAPQAAIAFGDGRQMVERITRRIDRDDVLPYRSGYEASDRRAIEKSLHAGGLAGLVATSALEVGIDIPQFVVGLNLGVPVSRKAFRQRVGRVGRAQRGLFVLIAPATEFTKLGTTFTEFAQGPVEPSNLYLDNAIIQYQQACCLRYEMGLTEGHVPLADAVAWPKGFENALALSRPGAVRPRELDAIAMMDRDTPHHAYTLRQLPGGGDYMLRDARNPAEAIGKIEIEKAMREAPPGATYRHLKRSYRVREWRSNSYDRSILIEPVRNLPDTQALVRSVVNVSLQNDAIIGERFLASDAGAFAEISMRVVESTEGILRGNARLMYSDLSKTDRRMTRKQREFSTTGILLRVGQPWFEGEGEAARAARRNVGKALMAMLAHDQNIASSDLRCAHTNVFLHRANGPHKIEDAVVIFDAMQGGLRLSSPLFSSLPHYLDRLGRAAGLVGEDALISNTLACQLQDWFETLRAGDAARLSQANPAAYERIVYAPESEVSVRFKGELQSRTLLHPEIVTFDEEEQLMYRYRQDNGCTGLVPHDRIEPVGSNWRQMLWTPSSGALREIEA